MQEIKNISCIHRIILFFCFKRIYIKFYKKELHKIAINHSANIDCKDFMKIYKTCANEPYSFLTLDSTLLANNYVRFFKNRLPPFCK